MVVYCIIVGKIVVGRGVIVVGCIAVGGIVVGRGVIAVGCIGIGVIVVGRIVVGHGFIASADDVSLEPRTIVIRWSLSRWRTIAAELMLIVDS